MQRHGELCDEVSFPFSENILQSLTIRASPFVVVAVLQLRIRNFYAFVFFAVERFHRKSGYTPFDICDLRFVIRNA
jgi:hypothetical protein